MWRSNYAPPLLRILWRLGIRLPPLPFMPFWQVTLLMGGLWGISWGCAMWLIMLGSIVFITAFLMFIIVGTYSRRSIPTGRELYQVSALIPLRFPER